MVDSEDGLDLDAIYQALKPDLERILEKVARIERELDRTETRIYREHAFVDEVGFYIVTVTDTQTLEPTSRHVWGRKEDIEQFYERRLIKLSEVEAKHISKHDATRAAMIRMRYG